MSTPVTPLVGHLRDFALSITPGAQVWPPDVVLDLVTSAADRLEELEFAHLAAKPILCGHCGTTCPNCEASCERCNQ